MNLSRRHGDPVRRRREFWAGLLLGAATMAAIDEIVFHQILGWHHFYDRSTSEFGLVSDGLLHAAELFCLAAGFFLMMDARRRPAFSIIAAWAGFLSGLGAFQLWDGIIDHKVLRIHQIRYGVDLLPYDVVWNVSGGVLLAAGIGLAVLASRRASAHARSRGPSL